MKYFLISCMLMSCLYGAEKATYKLRYKRQYKDSTVIGHGYAVAIDKRKLVSVSHLAYEDIEVNIDNKWVKATLEKKDDEFDICTLLVAVDIKHKLTVKDDRSTNKVQIIIDNKKQKAKFDSKSGVKHHYKVKGGKQGISGTAVVNDENELIGIVTGVSAMYGHIIQDTAVILPSRRIIQFMKEN